MANALEVRTRAAPLRVLAGSLGKALRRAPEWPGGAPLTTASLLALAVTTATLAGSSRQSLLAIGASTNLHNLTTHPVDVLFVSAFWVATPLLFWPVAAVLVPVMAVAEQRLGTLRTALVFVLGHVGATAVTVVGIGVGVAQGWLPRSLTSAVDVGPSYGLAAVVAVLVWRTRPGPRRRALVLLLLSGLAAAVALGRTFTDAGHLVAALLGLAVAAVPVRPPASRGCADLGDA